MEKKTVKLHTFNQLKDNPEILGNMAIAQKIPLECWNIETSE